MFESIPQALLPLSLAFVMFSMGMSLSLDDFKRIVHYPKAVILGLGLQLLFLPVLAIAIIYICQLSFVEAAGLFLLSLCPGGATSNFFSYLAKGNVALSISLTAITSLIVPFTLPVIFIFFVSFWEQQQQGFDLPVGLMMAQLILVTLVPVILGMCIKQLLPSLTENRIANVKLASSALMLLVVIGLILANINLFTQKVGIGTLAVMLLVCSALTCSLLIAKQLLIQGSDIKTICLEVGVQNAGTAMMVAHTVLQMPELATIPLMYGILMNLPVFVFIFWARKVR